MQSETININKSAIKINHNSSKTIKSNQQQVRPKHEEKRYKAIKRNQATLNENI